MATTNLSYFDPTQIPDVAEMRIGIVVSEWNPQITDNLLKGCLNALSEFGASLDRIHVINVPGSFELAMGAQLLIKSKSPEAVICLGSIIRGETPHFEFVSNACAQGIMDVGIKNNVPVIFGVLTDNNMEQAVARSGGALGNKGVEAAMTAVKMVALSRGSDESWMLKF